TELWNGVMPVNSGDTLYLGIQGTTLTVKLNGNTLTTVDDGSITAPGYPGFDVTDYDGQGAPGDGQLDDWFGGDFGGAPVNTITAPTNLTSTGATTTEIDLAWSPSTATAGVAGYNVFRNGTAVGTSTTTSFADTGLTPSTTYTYAVTAFDINGLTSSP